MINKIELTNYPKEQTIIEKLEIFRLKINEIIEIVNNLNTKNLIK